MSDLYLHRDLLAYDCSMGVLTVEGVDIQTLERPWIIDPKLPRQSM